MENPHEQSLAGQLFGTVVKRVVNLPRDAPREIGAEVVHQVGAGAHELAAALFTGSGFVMYQRGARGDHGVHGPDQAQDGQGQDAPDQHMGRGGRGL